MTSYPFPSWSEVKYSIACVFLSPHVGKPIPECMWAPCSRNTGWSKCAVIWDWQLQGFLLSFPVIEQVCCPSVHFSPSWSCCHSPSCSFPYLCPAWSPAPDIAFHFLLWLLPPFSLSSCLHAVPLDETDWLPAALALGAVGWSPASFPCSCHAAGPELLVASCSGL